MAIFRQKPWTNPFGKFRIFSLYQNFIFLVQKTFYSIQNNAKQFLSYFAKKTNMERGHFLTNTMDKPLWKLNFECLHFLQTSFFLCRKHSFLSRICQKRPLCLILSKKKKWVNPPFWSKNGHFSNLFFLGNIAQENVFYDILQRKNAFVSYKNKKFKKSKN